MIRFSTAGIPLLAMVVAAMFSGSLFAQAPFIEWRQDLEKAKQIAAAEEKLVLLHFSAAWCAPCKEIERFVFVNPMTIRAISSQVIPVKIDIDLQSHIAEEYNVSAVPYDVIITPAGHVITERTSPRSSDGYLQMIQSAQSGAAGMSEQVVSEVEELKQEIARQKAEAVASTASQEEGGFGAFTRAETNPFRQNYEAPAGAEVPAFENPKSWDQPAIKTPETSVDGVVANKFVAPAGDFQPAGPELPQDAPGVRTAQATTPVATTEAGSFQPRLPKINNGFQPDTSDLTNNTSFAPATRPAVNNSESQSVSLTQKAMPPGTTQPATSQMRLGNAGPMTPANPLVPKATAEEEVVRPVRIRNPMVRTQPKAASANSGPAVTTPLDTLADRADLGLEGYCPVTLMNEQKWVKGNSQWGCKHRGRLYLFASQKQLDEFRLSPDVYSPLLGGFDPVDYHFKGNLVSGQRKHGVFYGEDDGPTVIVLFANAENRARFEQDPPEYLRTIRQAMSRVDGDRLLR